MSTRRGEEQHGKLLLRLGELLLRGVRDPLEDYRGEFENYERRGTTGLARQELVNLTTRAACPSSMRSWATLAVARKKVETQTSSSWRRDRLAGHQVQHGPP
eukprot:3694921-Heterocapsa_arctica.AAC.1